MKYDYVIESFPLETSGYNVAAYTEGKLKIFVDGKIFFEAEGILLVEFAIVLMKWLLSMEESGPLDLYYASMDFEEEPIFALTYMQDKGVFMPKSIWAIDDPIPIPLESAKKAALDYLLRLTSETKKRFDVELDAILRNGVGG